MCQVSCATCQVLRATFRELRNIKDTQYTNQVMI